MKIGKLRRLIALMIYTCSIVLMCRVVFTTPQQSNPTPNRSFDVRNLKEAAVHKTVECENNCNKQKNQQNRDETEQETLHKKEPNEKKANFKPYQNVENKNGRWNYQAKKESKSPDKPRELKEKPKPDRILEKLAETKHSPKEKDSTGNFKPDQIQDFKIPIILVWTSSAPMEQKGIEFLTKKEYGPCRVTMDRSTVEQSAAVVLFNFHRKLEPLDIPDPKTRNSKQFYVFWTTETPGKTFHFKNLLENPRFDPIFNLSMSLMKTADVQITFGSHRRALEVSKRTKLSTEKNSPLWKKSKHTLWLVSNCYRLPGATERLLYAKSLVKAGLKLDKFGKCFNRPFNATKVTTLAQSYKFYLSFENSLHCPSYVTEKFWRNGLEAGLIPIVWGPTKQDLLDVAPPNSFIHSEDFKSPEDLVKYLNYLDKNHTAYMEYHKWRDTPLDSIPRDDLASGHVELLSKLCRKLVVDKQPPKTISSISKLIYETGYVDGQCLRPFSNLTESEQKEVLNF